MCVRLLRWAWKQVCPTPLAKFLLVRLADRANEAGESWPSYSQLARDCGMSRRSAIDLLLTLEKGGLVRVERLGAKGNRYTLASAASALAASAATAPVEQTGSAATAPGSAATAPVASAATAPKPKYNTPNNPHPGFQPARASRAPAAEDLLTKKGADLLGHRKRGFVRQMVARHGHQRVAEALAAVERKQPADPVAYFAAWLEKPLAPELEPQHVIDNKRGPAEPMSDELRDRLFPPTEEHHDDLQAS